MPLLLLLLFLYFNYFVSASYINAFIIIIDFAVVILLRCVVLFSTYFAVPFHRWTLCCSCAFQIDEDLARINVDDPKYQRQTEDGVIVSGVGAYGMTAVVLARV